EEPGSVQGARGRVARPEWSRTALHMRARGNTLVRTIWVPPCAWTLLGGRPRNVRPPAVIRPRALLDSADRMQDPGSTAAGRYRRRAPHSIAPSSKDLGRRSGGCRTRGAHASVHGLLPSQAPPG